MSYSHNCNCAACNMKRRREKEGLEQAREALAKDIADGKFDYMKATHSQEQPHERMGGKA